MSKVNRTQDPVCREIDALAKVAKAEKKLLKAEDLVTFAKENPTSALHKEFEWDDEKAAAKHRLDQARSLIQGYFLLVSSQTPTAVRAYISCPKDRHHGGGYRDVKEVMSKKVLQLDVIQEVFARVEQVFDLNAFLLDLNDYFREVRAINDRWRSQLGIQPKSDVG